MTTIAIICLVGVGIFVVAMLAAGLSQVVFYLMKGPLEDRIAARYRQDEILMKDLKANCFGVESAGLWQVRGNGGLVLTAQHLHFFMFLPKSEVCVPLDTITELAITKSHLGKATLSDLLKVRFSAEGKADSIAWCLTDSRAWKHRIEALRSGGPHESKT